MSNQDRITVHQIAESTLATTNLRGDQFISKVKERAESRLYKPILSVVDRIARKVLRDHGYED